MPPKTRHPRGGPRARASTARRRVRTTRNANNAGVMTLYKRRYRATKSAGRRIGKMHRKMRKMTVGGALWALITLIIAIVAVVGQSVGAATAAGVSLGVTVGVEKYQRRKGRSSVPPPRKQVPVSRGSGSSRSSAGTPGTAAPVKPTPVNLGGTPAARPRVCGKACQQSTQPKSTCRCTAPDCKHGTLAGATP